MRFLPRVRSVCGGTVAKGPYAQQPPHLSPRQMSCRDVGEGENVGTPETRSLQGLEVKNFAVTISAWLCNQAKIHCSCSDLVRGYLR